MRKVLTILATMISTSTVAQYETIPWQFSPLVTWYHQGRPHYGPAHIFSYAGPWTDDETRMWVTHQGITYVEDQ